MSPRRPPPGDSVRRPGRADLRGTEGHRADGYRGRDRARRRANAEAPAVPPAGVPRVHAPGPEEGAGQSKRRGENVRTRHRTCPAWRPRDRSGDSVESHESLLTYDPPYVHITRSMWKRAHNPGTGAASTAPA